MKSYYNKTIALFAILIATTVFLIIAGFQSPPRITKVEIDPLTHKQIIIYFNHTMDHPSVEKSFSLTPNRAGKFNWTGRNLVYNLEETIPSDQEFILTLGKEVFDENHIALASNFHFLIKTPKLKFIYQGSEGEEKNALVLSDMEGKKREILQTNHLFIEEYKVSTDGKNLYFLGWDKTKNPQKHLELYHLDLTTQKLEALTQNTNYLNNHLQLSPDGKYLALSRIQVSNDHIQLTQDEVWMMNTKTKKIEKYRNGEAWGNSIFFTPDSAYFLYKNSEGQFKLAPVEGPANQEAIYIGNFDESYGFSTITPLISFSTYDYSDIFSMQNFLTLFKGDGSQEKIDLGPGLSRETTFAPNGKQLITIFSGPNDDFSASDKESFYPLRIFHLYSYDLSTHKITKLTNNFDYSEEGEVVSPDSKYLLFERYETFNDQRSIQPDYRDVTESLSSIEEAGEIWRLDLETQELTKLGVKGKNFSFISQ